MRAETVHVAVGVIFDAAGRVLIAQRAGHRHQGGFWEFPGGKVESGEAVIDTLTRELREELGIEPREMTPLLRVPFTYPEKRVLLDCWRVPAFSGAPQGREGQPWRWVAPRALERYRFPPANEPIVRAAALPASYVITPPWLDEPAALLSGLDGVLAAGHRLVLWRAPALAPAALEASARAAQRMCRAAGARLMIHDNPALAARAGAAGVHLSAERLRAGAPAPPAGGLLAASCHDERELATAVEHGVDFTVLSPVRATPSHPEAEPMGWQRFATLVADHPRPVYALGGLGPACLNEARRHRAQGIAGIRGFWPG